MRNIIRVFILLACAGLLLPGEAMARGGGGFSGGGGSKGFSSGGGGSKSFSSPSKSFSAPSAPKSSPSVAPKGFSAGPSKAPATSPPVAAKPSSPTTTIDPAAVRARAEEQSRNAFRADNPTPKTAPTKGLSGSSQQTAGNNRSSQPRSLGQYSRPNSVIIERHYNDSFGSNFGVSPWFWLWLMQSNNQSSRDAWLYNHQDQIDPARLRDLKQEDADLNRRLTALEQSGAKRDPNFKHPEIDEANPPPPESATADEGGSWGFWPWAGIILFGASLIYLVFIRRGRPA